MNFVKFFYTESKLTDLRLHTYLFGSGRTFRREIWGIVSAPPPRRRNVFATPNFTIKKKNFNRIKAKRICYSQFYHLKNF